MVVNCWDGWVIHLLLQGVAIQKEGRPKLELILWSLIISCPLYVQPYSLISRRILSYFFVLLHSYCFSFVDVADSTRE